MFALKWQAILASDIEPKETLNYINLDSAYSL